jgi:hypothetical protein
MLHILGKFDFKTTGQVFKNDLNLSIYKGEK